MKKNLPYNTNLASEFWFLSALYRLGVDAHLTLGNKKAVDIIIFNSSNVNVTVDVKGVAEQYDWPADNFIFDKPNHYYALMSFDGNISDIDKVPSVWIIPSKDISKFIKKYSTRSVVSRALVKKEGKDYKSAWKLLKYQ
ncbi:MAG: hypothetical protein ACOWWO_13840 [Peptococcaceae bacterium]